MMEGNAPGQSSSASSPNSLSGCDRSPELMGCLTATASSISSALMLASLPTCAMGPYRGQTSAVAAASTPMNAAISFVSVMKSVARKPMKEDSTSAPAAPRRHPAACVTASDSLRSVMTVGRSTSTTCCAPTSLAAAMAACQAAPGVSPTLRAAAACPLANSAVMSSPSVSLTAGPSYENCLQLSICSLLHALNWVRGVMRARAGAPAAAAPGAATSAPLPATPLSAASESCVRNILGDSLVRGLAGRKGSTPHPSPPCALDSKPVTKGAPGRSALTMASTRPLSTPAKVTTTGIPGKRSLKAWRARSSAVSAGSAPSLRVDELSAMAAAHTSSSLDWGTPSDLRLESTRTLISISGGSERSVTTNLMAPSGGTQRSAPLPPSLPSSPAAAAGTPSAASSRKAGASLLVAVAHAGRQERNRPVDSSVMTSASMSCCVTGRPSWQRSPGASCSQVGHSGAEGRPSIMILRQCHSRFMGVSVDVSTSSPTRSLHSSTPTTSGLTARTSSLTCSTERLDTWLMASRYTLVTPPGASGLGASSTTTLFLSEGGSTTALLATGASSTADWGWIRDLLALDLRLPEGRIPCGSANPCILAG
mmetsp:Transcript_20074/g.50914  ORF Transcript_20074/g.50914 Transcript_20074/m.50914 type:complete len:595 (-) Transcript_20074:82-1866(-)